MKISIAKIDASGRGRKEFKDIENLAHSIKQHGLMHPLVVTQKNDGSYRLIAGERRMRACLLAGVIDVPVTLKEDITDEQLKEMELEENIQRVDLKWNEQCEILRQLDVIRRKKLGSSVASRAGATDGYSLAKMSQETGQSVGYLSEALKIANVLKDEPEIAKQIKHLPKKMAIKRANVLLEEKKLKRAMSEERLTVSACLKLGPCEKLIKQVKNETVSLCIMDPPYGCETMNQTGDGTFGASYGMSKTNMNGDRSMEDVYNELFPELFRVLKPGSHCYIFHAMEWNHRLKTMLRSLDFTVDDMPIIWSKQRMTTKPTDWHYRPCYEPVLFAIKNPRSRPLMHPTANIVTCQPVNPADKIHDLQKPFDLLKVFIENSSSIGEIVLDCFAGSASTLIAAKQLHRNALGFELSEGNYMRAQQFLKGEMNNDNLAEVSDRRTENT